MKYVIVFLITDSRYINDKIQVFLSTGTSQTLKPSSPIRSDPKSRALLLSVVGYVAQPDCSFIFLVNERLG